MADILSRGTLFPHELVTEMVDAVRGKSALAKLSARKPMAFSGTDAFVFTLDKEVDIVAENGPKTKGGATVTAKQMVPVKFEYGARVSDEYKYCSEEKRMEYLRSFMDGFAKKMARGMDIAAFHGLNPRTATASAVVNGNDFDTLIPAAAKITATTDPDADIEGAVAKVIAAGYEATGIALAPTEAAALAALKVNGVRQYPELAWGANPESLNGLTLDINGTVNFNSGKALAYVGDFKNMFYWGYADQMKFEVIEYGNPDNDATLGDLKGHNQVYIRAEMYIGWGILDEDAFALVKSE